MAMPSLSFVFMLLYSAVLWGITGSSLWRRCRAGSVLLRLGRDRTGLLLAGAGAMLLFAALAPLLESTSTALPLADSAAVARLIGSLSCAAYCLVTGLAEMQVRERGILGGIPLFPHFLEWERIESYEVDGKLLLVTVKPRRRFLFPRQSYQLTYQLPERHTHKVTELLNRYR